MKLARRVLVLGESVGSAEQVLRSIFWNEKSHGKAFGGKPDGREVVPSWRIAFEILLLVREGNVRKRGFAKIIEAKLGVKQRFYNALNRLLEYEIVRVENDKIVYCENYANACIQEGAVLNSFMGVKTK